MAETLTPIKVLVGQDGTVEIQGISSTKEAEKVAKKLGLKKFEKLIRADMVPEEVISHVTGRARILGYELKVGMGDDAQGKAVPARPASKTESSLPWRAVLGFGAVIVLLLALAVTLTGIGIGLRDRIQHEYTPVASLAGALSLTQNAPSQLSGFRSLINPDDTRYISMTARDWIFFGEGEAVLDGHYVQLEGLRNASLGDLLKNEGGLTFHIDTRQSTRSTLFIEEILAGGNPTGEANARLRAWPLAMGPAPAGYAVAGNIEFDNKASFENLGKLTLTGHLQRTDRGLRVFAGGFSIAVPEPAPGLERVLAHFVQPLDSEGNPVGEAVPSALTFYLEMSELFPWSRDGEPERRQLYQEIGAARLDGIELAGQYFSNS